MSAILAIFKKEIKRFFTDKRLLLSLLLPGLVIYFVYSIMGSFMGDMLSPTGVTYEVLVYNQPASLNAINETEELDISLTNKTGEVSNQDIESLKNDEISLIIVYETDFDSKIANGKTPKVSMHFL